LRERDGEGFVKWIPIVVPLFAVLMVILVYFIVGDSLAGAAPA